MKFYLAAALAALALPLGALPAGANAQDQGDAGDDRRAAPERCVSPTVLVSPFNNSPGALEQSRVSATIVERLRSRRGDPAYRVCKTSAVAPQVSEVEGVNEEPLTEDEMREVNAELERAE